MPVQEQVTNFKLELFCTLIQLYHNDLKHLSNSNLLWRIVLFGQASSLWDVNKLFLNPLQEFLLCSCVDVNFFTSSTCCWPLQSVERLFSSMTLQSENFLQCLFAFCEFRCLMSLFLIISSKTRHISVRGGHSPAVVLAGRLPVAWPFKPHLSPQ